MNSINKIPKTPKKRGIKYALSIATMITVLLVNEKADNVLRWIDYPEPLKDKIGLSELKNYKRNEVTYNWINAYNIIASKGTKHNALFIDKHGVPFNGISEYPDGWDYLTDDEQQLWRDEQRKTISETYGVKNSEDDIILLSTRGALLGQDEFNTTAEMIHYNANKKVVGDNEGRNRLEYITEYFSDVTGDKIIDSFLSRHIGGLAAGESQFDNSKTSNAGAIGIFQLMPHMIKNKIVNPKGYSIPSVKVSLIKQTELAKNLMEDDYQQFIPYMQDIADQYFDGDVNNAKELFIAPLIINSYNTGSTNITKILKDFMEDYPNSQSIAKEYDSKYLNGMGLDVFFAFTKYGETHVGTKSYGKHSQRYSFIALGYSRAIREVKIDETNYSTLINEQENERLVRDQENDTTLIQMMLDNIKNGSEESSNSDKFSKEVNIENINDHRPIIGKYLSAPNGVHRVKLPTRIQFIFNQRLNEFSDSLGIYKAQSKQDFKRDLTFLDPNPDDHRWRSVKVGVYDDGPKVNGNNDLDYCYTREETINALDEIHSNLQKYLEDKMNLDLGVQPQLVLTGVARDEEYKKFISNGNKNSTHYYGVAIDFRHTPELVNIKTKEILPLTAQDQDLIRNAFHNVLLDMQNKYGKFQGKIFVNIEGHHIHVVSRYNTDQNWQPKNLDKVEYE